jgi:hypothetical protein
MFRKLSVAALLVLASGAQAQKKVTTVPFCATPTPEAFACTINNVGAGAGGAVTCPGALAANSIVPASLTNPTGTHLSRLFPGACPAAGAARIGAWQAECAADIYQPIVRRLADAAAAPANAAALQTLCAAAVPTPTDAGTNTAFCNAQLSVTENAAAKAINKLGSSTWYNYLPVPTYTAIGGVINRDFGAAGVTEVYCVYWPSYAAVAGKTGGGTNKWAKNVINTVTTSSVATNAPAGTAGFLDHAGALNTGALATAATTRILRPTYQETITVNYFKSGPPATAL